MNLPEGMAFATKPQLAARMLARALDAGVPAGWVAGDEVYGNDPALRAGLEGRGVGYVLAVACDHPVATAAGKQRADVLVARLPRRAWQRLSAGRGAKGHRFYDWAWISITGTGTGTGDDAPVGGYRWLVVRRHRSTGELAYYRCYATTPSPTSPLPATS